MSLVRSGKAGYGFGTVGYGLARFGVVRGEGLEDGALFAFLPLLLIFIR